MQGCFSQEKHSIPSSPTHPTSTHGAPTVYQVLGHSRADVSPWMSSLGGSVLPEGAKRRANIGPGLGSMGRLLGEGQDVCAETLKYELGLARVVRGRK